MQKKLIVSYDSYSWILNCAGIIMQEPKYYEVIIINKDTTKQIYGCSRILCEDAIYAQRKYDLAQIGKELGIKKMYNLLHDENNTDILKLTVQLQFNILVGGVSEVFYQNNRHLNIIFDKIKKHSKANIYRFDKNYDYIQTSYDKVYFLKEEEFEKKHDLVNLIIGDSESEITIKNPEICYRI